MQYLEDDRHGHLYGRHVVAAIKRVRSLSGKAEGTFDMREVMGSFVAKLTLREMCVVLKEQKSWRQVRDFFAWMKLQLSYRPSIIAYTIVLRAYGQVGKIKLAEQTFLEMLEAGCEPDEVACGTMLCSYARWGRHKAMLSFYSAVQERGITPSIPVLNFMLSSLQKKSLHENVIYIWRQMIDEGVVPNHFTYTVVICSLVKEGLAEEAFKIFKEMKNLGFVPEEATYGLLVSLFSKRGDRDEALSLYEDMRSRGIVPSKFTCASLLTLYYKNGDYSKALSLFSEMERYGVVADEVIHGLLIRIYGKLGLYEDAQKTFEDIERLGLLSDEKTYTTMALVHLNFKNFEKALDIMEQMKSSKILFSRFSLIVLLKCYTMKEDLTSAEVAYQALSKTGLPDASSCNDMLNLYLRLGLMEKAKDFIAQIRKCHAAFDEELVKTVLKVYCNEGMLMDAEQLIEELSTHGTVEGSKFIQSFLMAMNGQCSRLTEAESASETLDLPDAMAFELMLMLCLADRSSKTQEKLKLLLKTKKGESVANQIICKFTKDGVSNAEYLYQLMIEFGCTLEDSASASMIRLYGKQHKLKEAQDIFEDVAGSPATGKVLFNSMIDAYIGCDKEEDAYLFYKEQTEKGHNLGPVAISVLVKALAKSGKYHEAEDVIYTSFQTNTELDTVAYNTFIKAMLEAGKLRFAVSIYERMLFGNSSPSIQTYNLMISVYGRGRNLDKAMEMFNVARSMGIPLDEKIYTNLICYYGKAGKSHEASALFCRMQEEGIKPGKVSYNIMINIYAAEGLYREAELLFQSMQRNGCSPDTFTYLALIRAYSKGLEYSEAEKTIILMQEKGISPSCAHFNLLLVAFTQAGSMGEAERIYGNLISTGLDPDLESNQIMLRGYLKFGHVEEGINFFERHCYSAEPDRFILSAAVHLYKSASTVLKAKELLSFMNSSGIPFLQNLEVGSGTRTI